LAPKVCFNVIINAYFILYVCRKKFDNVEKVRQMNFKTNEFSYNFPSALRFSPLINFCLMFSPLRASLSSAAIDRSANFYTTARVRELIPVPFFRTETEINALPLHSTKRADSRERVPTKSWFVCAFVALERKK
jgi:hypothetical protein